MCFGGKRRRAWLARIQFGYTDAKDISALKAVSQNLMHENLTITDGVYGILSENDVRVQIIGLSRKDSRSSEDRSVDELITLNKKLLAESERTRQK